jgi:Ecdysteroid kinase-like family
MTDAWYTPGTIDPDVIPRPYPARTEPLPWDRKEVNAQWLTRMLQYRYPGLVVKEMEIVELFDSHTTKLRIKVELNEAGKAAGLPPNLCLKSNWSGSFNDVDIHALEARFYHHLASHLKVPVPHCYYADWDDDGRGQGLIVLEDLAHRGGRFGHSTQHAGINGVASALEGLAKLHGSLWDSPVLADQKWLQTSMNTTVDNDQIRIMWGWIEKNLEDPKTRAVLPGALLDEPGRLQRAFDRLADWEHKQTTPYCLLLGDCHQGNTYTLPGGDRIWLDWQLVRRGRPWRDLTYFMVGSLTVDERRSAERDLLQHYRESLLATGARDVISLDEIWENYRRWVIYGMQAWIANMDEWGQDGLPMKERFFTAGEDLGTWAALLKE